MNSQAKYLGYAGLVPFLALNIALFTQVYPSTLIYILFTQYSAVLLSFFGGIHWYDAVSSKRTGHQLYVAMLPTIIGWICLSQTGAHWALGVLSISYLLILFYDKQVLTLPKDMVVEYTKLRMTLTTVVVLSHAVMIFAR
ncbi:DUF3429 domain-containing protein [Aestuariibacter sp. GS-14]|uniref:DUF3429 domain-containing protein n=1 Tax=Aestuariibacter sp. GS-14 TaxID=2590670 RepID=UPI001129B197|nr:DUF3429 domain-containing protein [Aestuariibacter sp. GS-14]TPV61063.1 DUF3429 domain-containing protein [Aestuariibacter sp. GS-14]